MQLSGLNVFPLVKMDRYCDGYFMDVNGVVYSNKTSRNGTLTRMQGTRQPSGHYYTLNRRSYRADALVSQARRHAEFGKETSAVVPPVVLPRAVVSQGGLPVQIVGNKAQRASKLLESKGYVLATVGPSDKLVFGTDPVFQLDLATAEQEALRIATMKPGTTVVLLHAVKSVVAGGIKWN